MQRSPIVLIAIPKPELSGLLGSLDDHPLYRDIAEQYAIPLFEDAWRDILSDRSLKSDAIHANAKGYRQFAEQLVAFLQEQNLL